MCCWVSIKNNNTRFIYIYIYIYIYISMRREDSSRAAACRADIFPSRERARVLTVAILFWKSNQIGRLVVPLFAKFVVRLKKRWKSKSLSWEHGEVMKQWTVRRFQTRGTRKAAVSRYQRDIYALESRCHSSLGNIGFIWNNSLCTFKA